MCKPDQKLTVKEKIAHSIKQTWYGGTMLWCAFMLTLLFLARIFDWRV